MIDSKSQLKNEIESLIVSLESNKDDSIVYEYLRAFASAFGPIPKEVFVIINEGSSSVEDARFSCKDDAIEWLNKHYHKDYDYTIIEGIKLTINVKTIVEWSP